MLKGVSRNYLEVKFYTDNYSPLCQCSYGWFFKSLQIPSYQNTIKKEIGHLLSLNLNSDFFCKFQNIEKYPEDRFRQHMAKLLISEHEFQKCFPYWHHSLRKCIDFYFEADTFAFTEPFQELSHFIFQLMWTHFFNFRFESVGLVFEEYSVCCFVLFLPFVGNGQKQCPWIDKWWKYPRWLHFLFIVWWCRRLYWCWWQWWQPTSKF